MAHDLIIRSAKKRHTQWPDGRRKSDLTNKKQMEDGPTKHIINRAFVIQHSVGKKRKRIVQGYIPGLDSRLETYGLKASYWKRMIRYGEEYQANPDEKLPENLHSFESFPPAKGCVHGNQLICCSFNILITYIISEEATQSHTVIWNSD